jgi:uncharacterized protein YfiM (DUF2279 family)
MYAWLVTPLLCLAAAAGGARDDVVRPPDALRATPHEAADRWFGPDKVQHFWASYAAVAFTFGGATAAGLDRGPALATAVAAGVIAGVAKELDDARRGWGFSVRDLAMDGLGIAAAFLLLREVR